MHNYTELQTSCNYFMCKISMVSMLANISPSNSKKSSLKGLYVRIYLLCLKIMLGNIDNLCLEKPAVE